MFMIKADSFQMDYVIGYFIERVIKCCASCRKTARVTKQKPQMQVLLTQGLQQRLKTLMLSCFGFATNSSKQMSSSSQQMSFYLQWPKWHSSEALTTRGAHAEIKPHFSWLSHTTTSDLNKGRLVATLPGTSRYRITARTGCMWLG